MKLKLPLPKQYDTGSFIGSVLFLYGRGMGLVGIATTLMGMMTWYAVSTERWPFLGVVPIWGFALIWGFFFTLVMIFVYMFVTPSVIAFSNLQSAKHENPIMESCRRIEKELEEIKKKLPGD